MPSSVRTSYPSLPSSLVSANLTLERKNSAAFTLASRGSKSIRYTPGVVQAGLAINHSTCQLLRSQPALYVCLGVGWGICEPVHATEICSAVLSDPGLEVPSRGFLRRLPYGGRQEYQHFPTRDASYIRMTGKHSSLLVYAGFIDISATRWRQKEPITFAHSIQESRDQPEYA